MKRDGGGVCQIFITQIIRIYKSVSTTENVYKGMSLYEFVPTNKMFILFIPIPYVIYVYEYIQN